MSKLPERETFVCKCHSLEHQIVFWYDDEDDHELYAEPFLSTDRNFFQRLWYGLKYTFGYKSVYGAWDSMIFKDEDTEKLRQFLNREAYKRQAKEYKEKK